MLKRFCDLHAAQDCRSQRAASESTVADRLKSCVYVTPTISRCGCLPISRGRFWSSLFYASGYEVTFRPLFSNTRRAWAEPPPVLRWLWIPPQHNFGKQSNSKTDKRKEIIESWDFVTMSCIASSQVHFRIFWPVPALPASSNTLIPGHRRHYASEFQRLRNPCRVVLDV